MPVFCRNQNACRDVSILGQRPWIVKDSNPLTPFRSLILRGQQIGRDHFRNFPCGELTQRCNPKLAFGGRIHNYVVVSGVHRRSEIAASWVRFCHG